jgi:hypothetical protein
MRQVIFTRISEGKYTPIHPWPLAFMVAKDLELQGEFEVIPITIFALIAHLIRNEITMIEWRVRYLFYRMGFIECRELEPIMWNNWRFSFWKKYRKVS